MRQVISNLCFALLLSQCVLAQQELWLYPPLTPDAATIARVKEASEAGEFQQFNRAIQIYLELADSHQGTSIGADCLFRAMCDTRLKGDSAGYDLLKQRLDLEYPGSFESIMADLDEVERAGLQNFITDYSNHLQSKYGAPRLDDILAGRDPDAVAKILALHPETRFGLSEIYGSACYRAINGQQWTEALRMANFGRAAFDSHPESMNEFASIVAGIFFRRNQVRAVSSIPAAPQIQALTPSPGSTASRRPLISARMTSGDYRNSLIDLASLVFKVDGVEQTLKLELKSETMSELVEGEDFEVLTLSFSPELAPGPHTIEITAKATRTKQDPPTGPPSVTQTWSFTVSDNPPPSTDQTLNVSKDSILSQQNPHRNEGANNLLQLSHRPEEKNKSNNPIIAFDLSNVNLTGLRKARLVLNIQECEQPKKWGPEGRNILAYPVNEEWVEGNGETIKTGQGEKTGGTGQGVTWFSPIDDNIANKVPNGALQWSGARPFLGPLTASPVLITNKQTGTIEFDVTQDVKSGFTDGWLIRKQDEAAFGNVRFYSKEGSAGNLALAPKLILEYNGPTAQAPSRSLLSIILQFVEQGYRQLQADRDAPGSGLSWLGRWWPAWPQGLGSV